MKPALETLVTGKDHKRERAPGNIGFRQKRGDIPYTILDYLIIVHGDDGRTGMLDAFQEFVDKHPYDRHGLDHFNTEHLREFFLMNDDAAAPCLVIHIQVEDKRDPHLGELK